MHLEQIFIIFVILLKKSLKRTKARLANRTLQAYPQRMTLLGDEKTDAPCEVGRRDPEGAKQEGGPHWQEQGHGGLSRARPRGPLGRQNHPRRAYDSVQTRALPCR